MAGIIDAERDTDDGDPKTVQKIKENSSRSRQNLMKPTTIMMDPLVIRIQHLKVGIHLLRLLTKK